MLSHLSSSIHAVLCLVLLSVSPCLLRVSGYTSTFDFDSHSQPQQLIDYINSHDDISWNATINPLFYERPYSFVQSLCGTLGLTHPTAPNASYLTSASESEVAGGVGGRLGGVPVKRYEGVEADVDVPLQYDARTAKGDMCPSLWDVRNQGNCGSCCQTTDTPQAALLRGVY